LLLKGSLPSDVAQVLANGPQLSLAYARSTLALAAIASQGKYEKNGQERHLFSPKDLARMHEETRTP
jgi:hypothetical protein